MAQHEYRVTGTVIGASGGKDWDPADDTGLFCKFVGSLYTIVLRSVPAGAYEYKVAADGAWDESWGADGGNDNIELKLDSTSDVRFLFDVGTHRCTTTIIAPDADRPVMRVVGDVIEKVGGAAWSADDDTGLMEYDGTRFVAALHGVPPGAWEYKITQDGGWDINYGAGGSAGGDNMSVRTSIEGAGGSTLYFELDPETHVCTCTVLGDGDPLPSRPGPSAGRVVRMVGSAVGSWDPDHDAGIMGFDQQQGCYVLRISALTRISHSYKVTINGSWDENYGNKGIIDGENMVCDLRELPGDGPVDVAFFFDDDTKQCLWEAPGLTERFMHAIATGDKNVVELYADVGRFDADTVNDKGQSLLHVAACNGAVDVLQRLMSLPRARDTVNQADANGQTPLQAAAAQANADVVRHLLVHGMPTVLSCQLSRLQYPTAGYDFSFSPPKTGVSLLWLACMRGHTDVVAAMLEFQTSWQRESDGSGWSNRMTNIVVSTKPTLFDLNYCALPPGSTPLIEAVRGRHSAIKDVLLVEHRPQHIDAPMLDLNVKDADGRTALMHAARHNDASTIAAIRDYFAASPASASDIAHPDPNHRCRDDMDALFYAVEASATAAVSALLPHSGSGQTWDACPYVGLNLPQRQGDDTSGRGSRTVLHAAAALDDPVVSEDMVKMLIGAGFGRQDRRPLNAVDGSGRTALHLAIASPQERIDVVRTLLIAKTDVNSGDRSGDRPLHLACAAGHVQIVNMLLTYNAVVGARNEIGRTPLHVAAAAGHVSIVKELLKYGAEVSAEDVEGHTPLFRVYLAQYEAPLSSEHTRRPRGRSVVAASTKQHSQKQVDEEATGGSAAEESREEIITTLLDAGADLNSEVAQHPKVMDTLLFEYYLEQKPLLLSIVDDAERVAHAESVFFDKRLHIAMDRVWSLSCRRARVHDLLMWLFFLVLLMFISIVQCGGNAPLSFEFQRSISNTLLGPEDGTGEGGFLDISDKASWFAWAETTLLPSLADPRKAFPAGSDLPALQGDVSSQTSLWKYRSAPNSTLQSFSSPLNALVGRPRLRAFATRQSTCSSFAQRIGTPQPCFGEFSSSSALGNPLPLRSGVKQADVAAAVNASFAVARSASVEGTAATYNGGWGVLVPPDEAGAKAMLESLRDHTEWISLHTRAVVVEASFYNPVVDLISRATLLVEFTASGSTVATPTFSTLKLLPYESTTDYVRLAAEILFLLMVCHYAVIEWRQLTAPWPNSRRSAEYRRSQRIIDDLREEIYAGLGSASAVEEKKQLARLFEAQVEHFSPLLQDEFNFTDASAGVFTRSVVEGDAASLRAATERASRVIEQQSKLVHDLADRDPRFHYPRFCGAWSGRGSGTQCCCSRRGMENLTDDARQRTSSNNPMWSADGTHHTSDATPEAQWSVQELKAVLDQHGVDYSGCVEVHELRALAATCREELGSGRGVHGRGSRKASVRGSLIASWVEGQREMGDGDRRVSSFIFGGGNASSSSSGGRGVAHQRSATSWFELVRSDVRIPAYLYDVFNYFDVAILAISLTIFVLQLRIVSASRQTPWERAGGADEFIDTAELASMQQTKLFLFALNLMLCWIKTLDYLKLNQQLSSAILIIIGMAQNVAQFMLIFCVFLVAFGSSAYVAFGMHEAFSHRITVNLVDTYKAALGDFDFEGASSAHSVLGSVYMVVFSFIMIILLLNLLIAVMSEAYEDVKQSANARWCYMQFEMIIDTEAKVKSKSKARAAEHSSRSKLNRSRSSSDNGSVPRSGRQLAI